MKRSLPPQDEERLIAAIKVAEAKTSGEIVVSIQDSIPQDIYQAAEDFFLKNKLNCTREHNAVLIMMAWHEQELAVIGDIGIHTKVPRNFWEQVINVIISQFSTGDIIGGLEAGIAEIARQLQHYFPLQPDNVNEIPDTIL